MEKWQYIELWYYTSDGLDDALWMHATMDDNAMVMAREPDGSTSWASAAAMRDSGRTLDDMDLCWEVFCQAVPWMIVMMEEANWPANQVTMLASF
jgi:hypothetical protein